MEETKQDELKKEFEERFCKDKLNEFHPDISPYDICAWIASKINEAKEQQQKSIIEKIDEMIDNTKQAMSGRRLTGQALGSSNMLILKLTELKQELTK